MPRGSLPRNHLYNSSILKGQEHVVDGATSHFPISTTISNSIALKDMADAAQEPLMRHESGDEDHDGQDVDLSDVSLLLEKNLVNPGIFVWLLTFSAGISGLLFGCMFVCFNKCLRMC